MKNLEPKTLIAAGYEDISKNSLMFNLAELDYFLYVKLEPPLSSEWYMYRIEEKKKDGTLKKMHFADTVRQESPTWLKFAWPYLNQEIGMHTYKITFVNKVTDVTLSLWFAYIIQSDNPDKPYVYMKREEEDERCNKQ